MRKLAILFVLMACAGMLNAQDTISLALKADTAVTFDSTRIRILEQAREYIGVHYRYGQSGPNGFDCSGYVKYVFGKLGFELPRTSSEQYKKSRHLKAVKAQPGDLVFFATRKRKIGHVGIYLGDNQFIHAPGKGRTVSIDSLAGPYYKRHLVGFGTYLQTPDPKTQELM